MFKTVEDLDSYLKQFNLRNGLIQLANFSANLFNKGKAYDTFSIKIGTVTEKVTITQWHLAFLVYRLIMSSNDGKNKNLEYKEVLVANSIQAQFDEAFSRENDIFSLFARMSQQQLWWQENQVRFFSRNHILLSEISKDVKFKNRINFDELFVKKYGLSIYEFMLIGWAVFGVSHNKGFFSKKNLLNHTVPTFKHILVEDKVNNFLALMSTNYDTFRQSARELNKAVLPGYEQYQFNPLFKYPIIETDLRFSALYSVAPYIVPNIFLLLRKLCDGLYWKLRDLFKDESSREFLKLFGEIFELYVGKQLTKFSNNYEIHKLSEDEASQKRMKIADWILLEKDTIIIFECKSQLFPQGLRETFNEEILKTWLVENIVKGVEQLYSSEEALISQELLKIDVTGRKVLKVIVTYENIYQAESKLFKDKIKEYVKEANLFAKYPHAQEEFYIMHISELEFLENVLKQFSFKDIFNKKEELDRKESLTEANDFIAVYAELDSKIILNNTLLNETYTDFFSTIIPSK